MKFRSWCVKHSTALYIVAVLLCIIALVMLERIK